jgi:hypothetical protein
VKRRSKLIDPLAPAAVACLKGDDIAISALGHADLAETLEVGLALRHASKQYLPSTPFATYIGRSMRIRMSVLMFGRRRAPRHL